jgi:hypothetical protein
VQFRMIDWADQIFQIPRINRVYTNFYLLVSRHIEHLAPLCLGLISIKLVELWAVRCLPVSK